MDGVDNWNCVIRSGCAGGGEIVHCNANYGHDYPFNPKYDTNETVNCSNIVDISATLRAPD